jgi:hypothetical protein
MSRTLAHLYRLRRYAAAHDPEAWRYWSEQIEEAEAAAMLADRAPGFDNPETPLRRSSRPRFSRDFNSHQC